MEKVKCKITGEKISKIMSFGMMPIANEFIKSKNKKQYQYKMEISFNEKYGLFQLVNVPNQKRIFNSNYAFLSSTSNRLTNSSIAVSILTPDRSCSSLPSIPNLSKFIA